MSAIKNHPILKPKESEPVKFLYEGKEVTGSKGYTIAAALHQAGYPVHSHSLADRGRSLECGIGKCGACEMLVDGQIKRICITLCDDVKEVREIPKDHFQQTETITTTSKVKIYKTSVVIVGAGPAGLATRQKLNEYSVPNIVVDSQSEIGGQFLMQTHQFFFFEKEQKFGGMRGFDIAKTLAGDDHSNILLNCTVWDILEGNRIAVKNIRTEEIFYIDTEYLVIATGAVPYLPPFENDDLPGVYTAAVVQKMMNTEMTLLGKNILTVGAGNIGYLTSYQLLQAGAKVKAIIEAQPAEGGFPVQANRLRRLGVPILLSKIILKAIPNAKGDGIKGAIIADAENFKPIPGTERIIEDIDAINICTGLVPDDQLLIKGQHVFGLKCYGAGDAIRIGEGTSAVLKGLLVGYEILESMQLRFDHDHYLSLSKEYIDSQQHPTKVIESATLPTPERQEKPFILIDCIYGFACNPCAFACPFGAIEKSSSSTVPQINFDKCIGCMKCVTRCPGLAIFGYNLKKRQVFLPIEFNMEENTDVYLVDNNGKQLGTGKIEKITKNDNLTHLVRIAVNDDVATNEDIMEIRGLIAKSDYPEAITWTENNVKVDSETYICHCEDVTLDKIMAIIGDRKFISIDEIKHTTRLGMGACRGKRCVGRLKQILRSKNVQIVGEPTPRAPLSNQITMGEVRVADDVQEEIIIDNNEKPIELPAVIAGGGIGGSALLRYMAEAGLKPTLINYGTGGSWRNIAGGRPAFSLPELSDIANHNLELFKELQKVQNIDFRPINYVTFAHDDAMYESLKASQAWQEAEMLTPDQFPSRVSPFFNTKLKKYQAALLTKNCWQATPGRTVDALRKIGEAAGGNVMEDCEIVHISKENDKYTLVVKDHDNNYKKIITNIFVNAAGQQAHTLAKMLSIETPLFPVKHQAFITQRLPMLGVNGEPLPMIIDRNNYRGFTAVYGQQLAETGQIIGCASPAIEPLETAKSLKINSKNFLEIVSEIFVDWIPSLGTIGFQALWSGYYVEPRMIIDPEKGLFIGLRGQGFMLGQYLAKLYVDQLTGKSVPEYFQRLKIDGDGLLEKAFK